MFSGFQSNAYQSNAYQIISGEVGIEYLGGDDTRYPWDRNYYHDPKNRDKKLERYENASQFVDRILESFDEKPEEQVQTAKEAINGLKALSIPEIPKPDFSLTYQQILDIQRTIALEIKRMYEQEEEDFLILAAPLLL
jgi:hypothetical protein